MVMNTDMDRNRFDPGQEGQHSVYRMNNERKLENLILIDEILEPNFLNKTLGFPKTAKIDSDKLILAGHSFGASSSLFTGAFDDRIKALLLTDNW